MTDTEHIDALMPEAYTFDICGFTPSKGGMLVLYYKDKEVYKRQHDTVPEILEDVVRYFKSVKR